MKRMTMAREDSLGLLPIRESASGSCHKLGAASWNQLLRIWHNEHS